MPRSMLRPRSNLDIDIHERNDWTSQRRDVDSCQHLVQREQLQLLDAIPGRRIVSARGPDLPYSGFSCDVRGAGIWRAPGHAPKFQRERFLRSNRKGTDQLYRSSADHDQRVYGIRGKQSLSCKQPRSTRLRRIADAARAYPPESKASA